MKYGVNDRPCTLRDPVAAIGAARRACIWMCKASGSSNNDYGLVFAGVFQQAHAAIDPSVVRTCGRSHLSSHRRTAWRQQCPSIRTSSFIWTTIFFDDFARIQARNLQLCLTQDTYTGALLRRSPERTTFLSTWALGVLPVDVSLVGQDKSLDAVGEARLHAASSSSTTGCGNLDCVGVLLYDFTSFLYRPERHACVYPRQTVRILRNFPQATYGNSVRVRLLVIPVQTQAMLLNTGGLGRTVIPHEIPNAHEIVTVA
jgi:hypothetical protein